MNNCLKCHDSRSEKDLINGVLPKVKCDYCGAGYSSLTIQQAKNRFQIATQDVDDLLQEGQLKATGANIHDIREASAYIGNTIWFSKERSDKWDIKKWVVQTEYIIGQIERLRLLVSGMGLKEVREKCKNQ